MWYYRLGWSKNKQSNSFINTSSALIDFFIGVFLMCIYWQSLLIHDTSAVIATNASVRPSCLSFLLSWVVLSLSATKWREWAIGSGGGVPGPGKGRRACWWWGSSAGLTPSFLICCLGYEISRSRWLRRAIYRIVGAGRGLNIAVHVGDRSKKV